MDRSHPQHNQLSHSTHRALRQLDSFREEYIQNWQINADSHAEQGHYHWMADQVEGYTHILEIGCGVGHSTLALLNRKHTLVCIEENPHCIAATQRLVAAHGYSVEVVKRATPHAVDINAYRLDYDDLQAIAEADCVIIEGDALDDPALETWLKDNCQFDAVTCWLLGTHNARGHNVAVDTRLMPTAYEHRIFVQNNVYELADDVLRAGGILNVIDRGQNPDSDFLRSAVLDGHRDQASVTSLVVESLTAVPYTETEASGAMPMQLTLPETGELSDAAVTLALISVTSRKPPAVATA